MSCISNRVNDARTPLRDTYDDLYKWPESDAEFMKSSARTGARRQSTVVDGISCRQMYLRSYTFSRKETVPEKTVKCLGKVKGKVVGGRKDKGGAKWRRKGRWRRPRVVFVRRVKKFSCKKLYSFFQRLLLCSATVDVADRGV